MRTLGEIIEAVKDNEAVSPEETRWAVLALEALSMFDYHRLSEHAFGDTKVPLKSSAEESFRRWKTALAVPPDQYMGPSNDPANPEYQQRRQLATKLYHKVMSEMRE